MGVGNEHVSERFRRLLVLYRKPDGSEWGGQDLENATGGAVTRSYVANLKNGRIENPGLTKIAAISEAMGFPPALWFGGDEESVTDDALLAAIKDETVRSILEEALRLRSKDRRPGGDEAARAEGREDGTGEDAVGGGGPKARDGAQGEGAAVARRRG